MRGFLACRSRTCRYGPAGPGSEGSKSDDARGFDSDSELSAGDVDDDLDSDSELVEDDDDESSSAGRRNTRRRNDNQRYGIAVDREMLLTNEDILFFGLTYAGFGEERQQVRDTLNIARFKAHFGPEPRTVKDILFDLKETFGSSIIYKDVLMAMNWLKLCKSLLHHMTKMLISTLSSQIIR